MMETPLTALTEDELDTFVSIAIRRAEILDEAKSPMADEAWREVMVYEERLAAITDSAEIPGGIARAGAVMAALSAGQRLEAKRLAALYLADERLPAERRAAIERAFREDLERRARRFPVLAGTGRLSEVDTWRVAVSSSPRVFPMAA